MIVNEEIKNTLSNLHNKIIWNGFYSYASFLKKENKEHSRETIINMLYFFLLSPELLFEDNLSIYFDSLSLLSYLYLKTENIYGLDWVYHLLKRLQLDIKKKIPLELKVKVILRYAHILNKENKCLGYINQLINEIEVNEGLIDNTLFNEWQNFKKEIQQKLNDETTHKNIKPYFDWKKNYEEIDCWNSYITDTKEDEVIPNQNKIQNIEESNNMIQETTLHSNILNNEQLENNNQENIVSSELNQNSISNKETQLPMNILKVLILSNETISNKLPVLPRYIYWDKVEELNFILFTLTGVNPIKCFKYEEKANNEELLFIIYSFIMDKQIIFEENTNINEFISCKDNNKYILIIATSIENKIKEKSTTSIQIPRGLLPFTDSSNIISELKENNFIYQGTPAKNFGNTCYFNAGLQCILHCNLFTNYFKEKKYYERYSNKNILVNYFSNLINSFNEENLKKFLFEYIRIETKYELGKQHDSPELVTDVLNILGMNVCRAYYEYHDVTKYKKQSKHAELEKLLKKESSIVTDLFYGQFKHMFICDNCKEQNNIHESFMLLDLPIPHLSIEMVLFQNENDIQKNVYVYYHQLSDLKAKYIKLQIKNQENIDVDVLVINYKTSKVTILEDNDFLFDLGLFSGIFNKNKYIEIVLYQKENEFDKPYYFVPCYKFIDKKPYKYEHISEYPLQVCINNSNKNDIFLICAKFQNALSKGKINLENQGTKFSFFEGENIINIDQESISTFINKSNHNYVLYFQTEIENTDTIPQKEQIKPKDATLEECFSLFYNNTSTIKCKKCKSNKRIASSFTKLPHYLILYFKRFYLDIEKRTFKKNERVIIFPPELELRDNDGNSFYYKAIALNIHRGNVKRGHYYAYCREGDKWYRFDDKKNKIEVEFEVSSGVLLVFYEKQSNN